MQLEIPMTVAKTIFDELNALPSMSEAQAVLHGQLKPYCEVNLEWRPEGPRGLPTINGIGWKARFLARPSDSEEPETSFFVADDGVTYVLRGDHRTDVQEAATDGIPGLLNLYKELKEKGLAIDW